ncbi:bifunctional 4-hydroxy-2-oxoglutarate aldolase/2-dehydro-3-deoxy-phosphogluconate aldolase [uncultured Cohaesibacter sp.]|uniref:bifunctional 4-hydroxy-2-oxoglutarate aldolase/2-dehydro-3-deoxy-phosphogluconate aldolase n=1 Tax=uncultured Cohaesibacter sp. TaxID=1002546 RepID=UPI002930C570|nr:bifunctional 4-hydroxy-2-oxoglutarate aldolase/2-dehydro-3-deoxy-phosphogluconate aldolase [uncultured Cohaesibacter sp.]
MHPTLSSLLTGAKVIPVLTIENADDALPLAHCLVENGLPILEISLRSDAALHAVEIVANQVEGATVGVGSILTEVQLNSAQSAGGRFGVSPGVSFKLLQALMLSDWPFLPGAATLSEMLTLRDAGFIQQKLFPATIIDGIAMLRAVIGPVSDIGFCPTGGVNFDNASAFLAEPNVFAVGGTWIAPKELIRDKNWEEIARRAQQAAQL